ncbi:MAG: hypothetical protein RG741_03575 [Bacteroidales bacterium]|nr:hypothetical protein [Bacteroidales bacterium]
MENLQKEDNKGRGGGGRRLFSPRPVPPRRYTWVLAAFVAAGILGGYAYYHFIGCQSGGCAITSNPYMSMLWGGIMGYLLPDFFVKKTEA